MVLLISAPSPAHLVCTNTPMLKPKEVPSFRTKLVERARVHEVPGTPHWSSTAAPQRSLHSIVLSKELKQNYSDLRKAVGEGVRHSI